MSLLSNLQTIDLLFPLFKIRILSEINWLFLYGILDQNVVVSNLLGNERLNYFS